MRRGGSTTMIPTARRCLGRLALLAAATATPVDYTADYSFTINFKAIF